MKRTLFLMALIIWAAMAASGGSSSPLWAQSGEMPKLINPNLNARISDHATDHQDPHTIRGEWTGLKDGLIYVDHSPFRITPATTLVAEGGYNVAGLVFERDKSVVVKFTPDVSTGEEGVPLALHVRIYPGQQK